MLKFHVPRLFVRFLSYVAVCSLCFSSISTASAQSRPPMDTATPARSVPLLDVIEVDNPLRDIPQPSDCTVKLMEYSFGQSYGKPFIGSYTPPPCRYNRVALKFRVTSAGRQFDRLAIMYLNDTEIWRTSTAEPTTDGIVWTYEKDVSNFIALWKQPHKVVFDLGNLIDEKYTGAFNTTLIATFYTGMTRGDPADMILSVSKQQSALNQSSAFIIPQDGKASSSLTIPRNVRRAVFTISACGQANEEFWWSNVPSSSTRTFGNSSLLGYSPWRELQLFVDGRLAGVAWPFPIIFTGGVVPALWRPIVGIDTYDLKEDEIDVTPWLALLSDGAAHTFEIRVVGLDDDGAGSVALTPVGSNWVLTGKLFLWLDIAGSTTSGQVPQIYAPEPMISIKQSTVKSPMGQNASLAYTVTASRAFKVDANITTSEGTKPAGWKQNLTFSNIGGASAGGNNQTNDQLTTGVDISSSGYSRQFSYPLKCDSSAIVDNSAKTLSLHGIVSRGKTLSVMGNAAFPSGLEGYGSQISPAVKGFISNSTQKGEADYWSSGNVTKGAGVTEQVYTFKSQTGKTRTYPNPPQLGESELLYSRHVLAKNGKLTNDETIMFEELGLIDELPVRAAFDQRVITMDNMDPSDVERTLGRKYRHLLRNSNTDSFKASQTTRGR